MTVITWDMLFNIEKAGIVKNLAGMVDGISLFKIGQKPKPKED